MSLCATYVRAVDNLYYADPTFRGDDYFICFDDDDPPEIVIDIKSKRSPQEILKKLGIKYSVINKGVKSSRIFNGFKDIRESKSWFFEIKEKIPIPHTKPFDGKVGANGCFYSFLEPGESFNDAWALHEKILLTQGIKNGHSGIPTD